MRVGIIQSNYLPWRGYFDFIDDVDLFIFLDDVQYTTRDWRNRNLLKTPKGTSWITVPVKYQTRSQLICETLIDYSQEWQIAHTSKFLTYYSNAPFHREVLLLWKEALSTFDETISQLNVRLTKMLCSYLGITTPTIMSSELKVDGSKADRLIGLLKAVNASTYLAGPSSRNYLDEKQFRKEKIGLEYKTYEYNAYIQLWDDFVSNVSIIDLIANLGLESRKNIKSRKPNEIVVESAKPILISLSH
jgi:hypothetical protein